MTQDIGYVTYLGWQDWDQVEKDAATLYESERRIGFDPAWINVHPKVRAEYEQRVADGHA